MDPGLKSHADNLLSRSESHEEPSQRTGQDAIRATMAGPNVDHVRHASIGHHVPCNDHVGRVHLKEQSGQVMIHQKGEW